MSQFTPEQLAAAAAFLANQTNGQPKKSRKARPIPATAAPNGLPAWMGEAGSVIPVNVPATATPVPSAPKPPKVVTYQSLGDATSQHGNPLRVFTMTVNGRVAMTYRLPPALVALIASGQLK